MASNMRSDPINAVFGIAELRDLIIERLDEISLLRMSALNHNFRTTITKTSRYRSRIGFCDTETPKEAETIDLQSSAGADDVRWNPLLDWITFRCFDTSTKCNRPLDECPLVLVTAVLPHAARELDSGNSSLWDISVTIPPANFVKVGIVTHEGRARGYRTFVVEKDRNRPVTGVTIGKILWDWRFETEDMEDGREYKIAMWLPWPDKKFRRGAVCSEIDAIAYNMMLTERALKWETWHGLSGQALRKIMTSKEEQNKHIIQLFRKRARAAVENGTSSATTEWPAWPALALPEVHTELDGGVKRYEVEYASGIAFQEHRQTGAMIELPYNDVRDLSARDRE